MSPMENNSPIEVTVGAVRLQIHLTEHLADASLPAKTVDILSIVILELLGEQEQVRSGKCEAATQDHSSPDERA